MNKPILFNTEMVKAIRDGRKTQTRRIIKDFAGERITSVLKPDGSYGKYGTKGWQGMLPDRGDGNEYCIEVRPPCEPGDILWVRETWRLARGIMHTYLNGEVVESGDWHEGFEYKAGGYHFPDGFKESEDEFHLSELQSKGNWHPCINMPKEAARIFLRVEDVRVERLRDISADDAMDEGFDDWNDFVTLWDTTIKPADRDQYGWNANPWVWVIEFERCERPADFL